MQISKLKRKNRVEKSTRFFCFFRLLITFSALAKKNFSEIFFMINFVENFKKTEISTQTNNQQIKMRKLYVVLAMILGMNFLAFSQVTTSAISGRVIDSHGEPVIGATVQAVHQPSGTFFGVITNIDGRYTITGMRSGGPYEVTISFIGLETVVVTGVYLALGETTNLSVTMRDGTGILDEVQVVAERTRFTTERTGAATNINNRQITSMPSINRSVNDVIRMSPFVGSGMSIAGGDGRSTNFTVDGANFNNNMGLTANLPGGGVPISLDAIEEMQVVVAPFDVRQTNFIGGGVNAITRSGTNQFRGSIYTFNTNQDWRGNRIGDVDFGERSKESVHTLGFTLGGPIIENRLFFFVNAEMENRPGQVINWRASEDGVANIPHQISRARISDMELVRDHLMNRYGYNAGSFTDFPGDESARRMLARIDWNINSQHRLSVRYNYTFSERWMPPNAASSDFLNWPLAAGGRVSQLGMPFSNALYSFTHVVSTFAGELNSRFSHRLSNQFLVTHSIINDLRGSNSEKFPFIDIMPGRTPAGAPIIQPYISAGFELFSWNNGVRNNTFTVTNNLTYFLDNHRITAGLSYEHNKVGNAFMRAGTGHYRFASVEEFLSGAAPVDFSLTYGWRGEENPMATVAFHQIGAYLQNEWDVTPRLKLMFGARADLIVFDESYVMKNQAIYSLNFAPMAVGDQEQIERRVNTGVMPDPRIQLSPRLGFSWDVQGDRSLMLRGGTGLFAGRLPMVFFTNQPNQSGMLQGNVILRHDRGDADRLALLAGGLLTDVNDMIERLGLPTEINPEDGIIGPIIAATCPNFKMPQVWKTSLAVDFQLPTPFPMTVTVEGIFNNMINDVTMINLNARMPDETWQRFGNPNPDNPVYDNRWIHPATLAGRNYIAHILPDGTQVTATTPGQLTPQVFVLSNTNKGWGAIGNITVTAQPVRNLNLMAAYTITESQELTGMPGSSANSIFQNTNTVNGPIMLDLQRSQYVVPHRVIGSIDFTTPNNPWLGRVFANTQFNLFYSGTAMGGFSYTMLGDMNNDGFARDLIWIPRERGDIRFVNHTIGGRTITAQEAEDAFFRFMDQCRYLTRNRGSYAEANAVTAPWLHRFDFRIARTFNINRNSLQFSLDIMNVGNLLNSEWGIPQNMSAANGGAIMQFVRRNTVDNVPEFSVPLALLEPDATPWTTNFSMGNTWRMQFGVRYTFN